jgi:hypothetical protein
LDRWCSSLTSIRATTLIAAFTITTVPIAAKIINWVCPPQHTEDVAY